MDFEDFIAIDFETGKYAPESAISIGMIKYIHGEKVDSFYSLIRPPVLYIRPDFTQIHGLTVFDVKDAPTFDVLWQEKIKAFLNNGDELFPNINKLPFLAHNASFDMGVLASVLQWYKIEVPDFSYVDSLEISRKTWPELQSHALTFLGKTFGIEYEAHNALADAETCAKIVMLAQEKVKECNPQQEFCYRIRSIIKK